ncbi:hypothetical protein P9112_002498 [Eukaryota sp. TZLM1-RC]
MTNPELPRRERVLPWEVNRPERQNTTRKTTVATGAAKFFASAARNATERQFRYIQTVSVVACRLAQYFLLMHPNMAHWLYHQQFWYQCQDIVVMASPPVQRPFENHRKVYEALCSASDPTRWLFPSLGYATAVLKDSAVSKQLLGWYEQHHAHITALFNQQVGDPDRFQALLEEVDTQLNVESMTFIFSAGPRMFFLENMAGETMKRLALAPSASYSPGIISFSQQVDKHFLRLNPNRQLLRNSFKLFNKKNFATYILASNGLSLRVTFSTAPKRTKHCRSAREFDARASGHYNMPAKSRMRNSRLQQQVRPRQRRRTEDAYEPPPVDPIEYSFCAIDPNPKNLCGYLIGSRMDDNNVNHQLSGCVLNPRAKNIIQPPFMTHASPNCYFVQNFREYSYEIATPLMWVPTQEEISNPDFRPRTILDQLLINGDLQVLRRNKFDFFIRRQKRIMGLMEKIKLMTNGRETIIWFGSGGEGPSRQDEKTPRKRFLKEI